MTEANSPASLPSLPDMAALASAMGRSEKSLRWLAFRGEPARRVHYVTHAISKGDNSTRPLLTAHRELAIAQDWILRNILDKLPLDDCVHGFRPGRSVKTFAAPHCGKQIVVALDLEDFFGHCYWEKVYPIFTGCGYSFRVAQCLASLCVEATREPVQTERGLRHAATGPASLPQGACTSPGLANHCAAILDGRMLRVAERFGCVYTRYSDDLAFSPIGEEPKLPMSLLPVICRGEARKAGFRLNGDKTRFLRNHSRQKLAGVICNAGPSCPPGIKDSIRTRIHRIRLFTEGQEEHRPTWELIDEIRGQCGWLSMFEPERGSHYLIALHKLVRQIPLSDIKHRP